MIQLHSNHLQCSASAQKTSGSHYNFSNAKACKLRESKIYQMYRFTTSCIFLLCSSKCKIKLTLKLMQNFQPAAPENWRKWDPLAKFNTSSHSTETLLLKHVGRKSRSKNSGTKNEAVSWQQQLVHTYKYWLSCSLAHSPFFKSVFHIYSLMVGTMSWVNKALSGDLGEELFVVLFNWF